MADDITLSNSIEDAWELNKELCGNIAKGRARLRILLANLTERIENVDIDIHSEELKSQLEIPEIGNNLRTCDSGKLKTGRVGKKLWLSNVPHGVKWNKSLKVNPPPYRITRDRRP